MRITDEQKERAAFVNLPQFLMAHGFDLKKVGREYVWKDHDSLHIKDNGPGERGAWFRFSEDKGGDNIGFLREYMGMSFVDAVEALTGEHIDRTYTPSRTYQPKPVQQTARELSLAEADNARRVFAYLCKTRGLDYDMVSALVRGGSIAQEEKTGNVLFKYYDDQGKIIGAEKVGTSTEHKFKGIATGSVAGHGFEVVRGSGEKAFFFESAIDMLSYLQMHDKELTDCRLVSMMGVKPNIVLDTMLRHNISPDNVFLCSDNDTAGNEFAQRLQEQYPDMKRIVTPDTYKDWNDMLRGIPKQIEVEQETKTKEVDSVADLVTYGNRMWNDATDNRDKSLISMQLADFQRMQETLERSGINYYAYEMNGTVRMAVNDKDTDWLRKILGNVSVTKSNRPYSPPEKNIFGPAEYRYIPQKEYVTADRDLVLKMADIMARRGMQFSGRVYPTGKGTLTVSHKDLYAVRNIRDEVTAMRRQFASPEKGEPVGNRDYRANRDTHYYMSKLTIEQFKEIKPFLETSVSYHAISRDGKVAFALDKENAPAFHRALESAQREVGMVKNMSDLGLPMEQMIALSPVIHRLAVEDMQLNLADFFDKRYDEAQFGEMLSLVNAYLSQAPAERYGEQSKLNDMLEAKSSFDRAIELSDFFSQHDFSDEQRAAITAMFVGDVTRGQLESIDETFTAEDIQAYDEILHNALQESDVADFLTAHKQAVIERENAARVPTEEEVLFPQADLAKFIAERTPSSDEWEDMAYPMFERGYLDKHKPSDKGAFGYNLSEADFYALADRFHHGDDIRKELALGLLEGNTPSDIEFVFEDGKMSDRTYYYDENLRHSLHLERTEDGYHCSFGGMERFVSFEEIGQAFIDRIHEEFDDLAFWWVRDDMLDAIPDISDEKIADLITAFDGAAMHGWENGDNQPKLNRIKKALFDILGDEEQTEKAFAVIAKNKYNVSFEAEKPEIAPDSLSFHFGKDKGDEWVSESDIVHDFALTHPDCSFALGNAVFEYLDEKQHSERKIPELKAGWYKKTDFSITAVINGEEFNYDGRFDIGDGKGTGGGSLIDHIRTYNEGILRYMMHPFNQAEYKERAQRMLDIFIPFLESHSELTAEEQRILDDFKEQHPIRTIDDVEKAQGRFQIYQLPSGDKYHGIRFADMDELKAEGVQLNHEDYELVYEGIVGEFRGNATLEALYTQFNTNHPEDFRGHSLSVSDVVVIDIDGEQTAYYCDTAGFVEMPEFFREKDIVQEKPETAKVSDLAVGDIIMYDGARREIEEISPDRIKMKDLDAPDYGGILLGTSDVLAYDGWQQDMESKGFEILSKAEKPAVEAPEQAEPEDKGPVSLRKVGDFYEMYGKNAEIGAEVLGLRMLSKHGSPMVGFPDHVKDEYSAKLREAGYIVLIEQAFELNPPKRDREYSLEISTTSDAFDEPYCIAKVDADGDFIDYYENADGHIQTFTTIVDALYYAEKHNLDVKNDMEEIPENLCHSLNDVVDRFFGTDCSIAETVNGTWRLSVADDDKVGELFYGGEPACGIYNRGDKMEIESYSKEGTFAKLLQAAMLEHNPDKPVEVVISPDARETSEKRLVSLEDVIAEYFNSNYIWNETPTIESEGGTWRLSVEEARNGYTDPVIYHNGTPMCSIHYGDDTFFVEPYQELSSIPNMVANALRSVKPDKHTQLEDFQRTFETPLDKAKWLINDFCEAEYREGADFDDLHNIGLAFTTLTDDELPIQVTADLVDFKITYEFDGEVYNTEQYDSIEDMIENGLTGLDFSDLVSVPDEVIDRHTGKGEQTVDLMSDAADISDTSSPAEDVPAVTLKYKGDAESLDEIKDKALSLGATVIIDNAEGVISIDTYENHQAELDGLAYELGIMRVDDAPAVETPDIDKPLFTDAAVIDQIQRNENDDVPFWEKPDIEGEQLSLFGDPEPLTVSKPAPAKQKSEFAKGPVVDGVQVYEALAAEIDRGTGFVHGKLRVQDFYEEKHPTIQELADFLKKEYGIGGHSGEGKISLVDYNSQGITFNFENGEKFRHSWYNVAVMTESRLRDDTYLSAEQKAERAALKSEQAQEQTPHTVEVGDRFRHKITGEVSEVISLTGALPFYSDDCTVQRESGGFAITENISYDKLLNSGLYEYIGRAEPEKEKPAPVKPEPEKAEVTPDKPAVAAETEKAAIPTVKNLSQLKKAIKPGMMFEITDHLRPECIGERRVVTAVNTVDFTSRKLDENGEPTGKDLHMEFDRAKNWSFDGGELTSHMEDGSVLMSFHFIDGSELIREPEHIPFSEEISGDDDTVKYRITENADEQYNYNVQIFTQSEDGEFAYSGNGKFCETLDDAHAFIEQDKAERQETKLLNAVKEKFAEYYDTLYEQGDDAVEGYNLAVAVGDEYIQQNPVFVGAFNELRGDILSSDREMAAFAFALADFGVIDRFVEPAVEKSAPDKGNNFTITDDSLGEGGAKAKFRANVDAIRTLKTLEAEKRPATAEEKETLSKYVGWGALSKAFDKDDPKWAAEYKELAELLTPEEYRQARASVNDAFYTSPTIIDGIYEALDNFGFDGGAVLEPAMGIGNFFGRMPEEMQAHSQLYGVEIDSLSGRIAQALYPDADIAIQGFEKNRFQNGCFDVAVGNVPFGELGFRDTVHDTTKLHDYFFAEALSKLKNGGIMAFVTSAGTLDKRDESTRQMLADKADFIGAIRLPGGKNGAFHDNAGTDVTTDIIFLQKHEGKTLAEMSDIPDWVHIGETADGLPINKYFEQHPDMVLGTVVEGNKLYGSGTMVVAEDGFDLRSALHEAVGKLSAEIGHDIGRDVYAKTADGVQVQIPSNLRNYSFFMSDDQIFFKKNNAACEFRFDKGTAQHGRFKAFIELRDLTRELIEAMELNKPDSVIKDLQAKLNVAYDDFYNKYGLIHSQTNKRYFSEDVSYNLVAGLEKSYDKTKLKEKSDIFTKRTIVPPKAVDHVDTALEALTLSIAEKARVDFEYMSGLTGMTEDELKRDLTGEIFKVPHTENGYQTASEYLSGDIRAKLREAEEIAEYDADFNINVSALKAVMPEPLKAGDIDVKLGAAWIEPKYYEQFLYELLQTPEYQRSTSPSARWNRGAVIGVEYSEHTNSFHVSNKSADRSVLATQKYGSPRMNAYDIYEHILNLQEPKVYKTIEVPDGFGDTKEKRIVDIDATRVVQRRAESIRKAFKEWIFRDPARREDIVKRYNELFNSIRPREYDGSALSFPMMTTDIQLHDHQKNAIAHAMFGGNTLFAHCVGAGKTYEMIATAMESKRLGLCTKSLFAVPNHLTQQIGDDFQKLYPGANILVATKKDFKKENRQQLFAKIATGNYDAVIIGHSQLGMIPVSKERQVMTIQSQIDDILQGIEELKRNEGSKFQIKAMERTRKSLQKQLDKLEKAHQDDTLTFEQLGVDKLFIDEAHEFKNLFVSTKLQNVAGISSSASQKALDLFLKCRYLDEKTGGKGVVFATGTPYASPYQH